MGKLNVNYMYEQQIRKKGFKKAYVFTMELCSPVSYLKMSKELSDFIYEQHIYTIQNFMDWCEMLTRDQMLKLSSEKITRQTLNLYEKINKEIKNNYNIALILPFKFNSTLGLDLNEMVKNKTSFPVLPSLSQVLNKLGKK